MFLHFKMCGFSFLDAFLQYFQNQPFIGHRELGSACSIGNTLDTCKTRTLSINSNFTHRLIKIKEEDFNTELFLYLEAFKAAVSKDVEERRKDRQIRKEKSETLRVQAQKAFRRGEFERALCCYEKVSISVFFLIIQHTKITLAV